MLHILMAFSKLTAQAKVGSSFKSLHSYNLLISADPYEQPETEEFYIEGNKVEISDADDVYEPVKVKKEVHVYSPGMSVRGRNHIST
ncbi:uncharacterized protein LOC126292313 isoform X3 [Schistocerca gregaria]|uniref:uncharacterized protein LOC126292313 isoform X3 n=1 Tax=Schistocerca gregaria TaxID=7010 RepID=UPI00211F00CF|nr:uncharacterized protein LOC126292313 isoform X3 [Schistocerca gregaria]